MTSLRVWWTMRSTSSLPRTRKVWIMGTNSQELAQRRWCLRDRPKGGLSTCSIQAASLSSFTSLKTKTQIITCLASNIKDNLGDKFRILIKINPTQITTRDTILTARSTNTCQFLKTPHLTKIRWSNLSTGRMLTRQPPLVLSTAKGGLL